MKGETFSLFRNAGADATEKTEAGDGFLDLSCVSALQPIESRSVVWQGKLKGSSSRHPGETGVVLKDLGVGGCNIAVMARELYANRKIDLGDLVDKKECQSSKLKS